MPKEKKKTEKEKPTVKHPLRPVNAKGDCGHGVVARGRRSSDRNGCMRNEKKERESRTTLVGMLKSKKPKKQRLLVSRISKPSRPGAACALKRVCDAESTVLIQVKA